MESINAGKKIKDAREARGLTQEELAVLLGYSHRSAVNKLESKESLQTRTLEKSSRRIRNLIRKVDGV